MRNLARILAVTVLGLLALVPIPVRAAANVLDVTAETANRVTATDDCLMDNDDCIHVLTATVTDAGVPPATPVDISFEIEGSGPSNADGPDPGFLPDATCTTVGGICEVSLHASTEGTGPDTIRAWIDDGNPFTLGDSSETLGTEGTGAAAPTTDVVEVNWYDGVLNVYVAPLTPSEVEEKTFGPSTEVKFEALVVEAGTFTAPATPKTLLANVDAEIMNIAGAANPDLQSTRSDTDCDTAANGKCELKYMAGAALGVDTIRAWIDRNENPNSAATPKPGDEEPGATSGYEGEDAETFSPDDSDITDVVRANISATPVLTASPSTQTKTTSITTPASLTASLTSGNPPTGVNAQRISGIVLAGGPNANKAVSCNTGSGGTCSIEYTSTTAGTDKLRLWVDTNANGQPEEADLGETDVGVDGSTPEADTTTVVRIVWTAPTPPVTPPPDGDGSECEQAKKDVRKAKRALKKAQAQGDENDIKKAKRRLQRTKNRRTRACAG